MPEVPVTILVEPDRFDAVLHELARAQVRVDAELRAIGRSAPGAADRLAAIGDIDGVLAASRNARSTSRRPTRTSSSPATGAGRVDALSTSSTSSSRSSVL